MSVSSQRFLHEIACVPKRHVLLFAEHCIALLLIKRQRLEIKGIEVGVMAAAPPGLALRFGEQAAAIALAAQAFLDPERGNMQPAPAGVAVQPADHAALLITQEKRQRQPIRGSALRCVIAIQPLPQNLQIGLSGRVRQRDRSLPIPFSNKQQEDGACDWDRNYIYPPYIMFSYKPEFQWVKVRLRENRSIARRIM